MFIKTQVKNQFRYRLTAQILFVVVLISGTFDFIHPKPGNNQNQDKQFSDLSALSGDNLSYSDADSTDKVEPSFLSDSTSIPDSLALSDSLNVEPVDSMAIDSTARIQYFTYKRKDNISTQVEPKRISGFFAKPSTNLIKRTVTIDSTGEYVEIREKVGNYEYKTPLKIPLDVYIRMKLEADRKKQWQDQGYSYELKSGKKDLSELISEITNIEIPLPTNALLSIFGEPKISLRINGAVDIYGAWRSETTEGYTASLLGNTKNEPDFRQQVQINVSGTIGDKLEISADWNTERTFEYENQLKIKYTGYEDEIVKSVEAGNVSLQTSPLIGGSEALFGVKAEFQMGPFSLTALASQKKAEIKEKSVSGGTTTSDYEIEMINYSENHYFVDLIYADRDEKIFQNYFGNATPISPSNDYVIDKIEVWKSTTSKLDEEKEVIANAFIHLPLRGSIPSYDGEYRTTQLADTLISSGLAVRHKFVQLVEDQDYVVHPQTGFITFLTSIQNEDNLAVAYTTLSGKKYGEFETDFKDKDSIRVFKLIKPEYLKPEYTDAWKLQLRNIYSLGAKDVKKEGFELYLKYNKPGEEPVEILDNVNLLQAFGLDKYDESSQPNPDQKFDFLSGTTIWPASGDIVFPVLEPFGKDFPDKFGDATETYKFEDIYTKLKSTTRENTEKNKFILTGQYSGTASSTYQIGFNVVENSVKVKLNGRELSLGTDYVVDYNIGQVTIRNSDALAPGANLSITYEENDLFSLASKTLLGFRGLYSFSKETQLGFSLLNLNQQTLSDKVRIGEEPLSNTIMGLDFKTSIDLPFVTKGLDNVISTNTMSSLALKGEFAYMNPDPNTKKSDVASDNGESIAYIDDFEGAKKTIPLGINYSGWRDVSIPLKFGTDVFRNETGFEKLRKKAKTYWYNVLPANTNIKDIYGDRKDAGRNEQTITVLDLFYKPNVRGMYNHDPDLGSPLENWGGMMRPLSSTANNLEDEKIEFIEFWMKVDEAPPGSYMYIDLGSISEDIIPNGELDTEDKNGNDRLEESEDTGIDGLTDVQEQAVYPNSGSSDPSNDNFAPISSGYENINGTQGNAQDISGGGKIPDTEDLNRNLSVDKIDSYFRYKVFLRTDQNPYIVGSGGGNNWYQFRIPLKEAIDSIGSPTLTDVKTLRVWFTDVASDVHLRFAEFNLSGTQWQKVVDGTRVTKDDEVLTVSTISFEESDNYKLPPGIQRELDRTQTDTEVRKNEQSLLLKIRDLKDGDYREAFKKLYRSLDVFNYSKMKLFVYGEDPANPDPNRSEPLTNLVSEYKSPAFYASQIYFRFGTDSSNFYEYRQPVRENWNEITIDFEKLTTIKQRRSADQTTELVSELVDGTEDNYYGVKGNPTLTKVEYFTIGIINPKNIGTVDPVNGDIWINELRVIGADDTKGYAYTGSATLKLADFMTLNFNYASQDPYFHKLSDRFGTRNDSKKWAASVDFNATKLLPTSMNGSNVRINYSRSENISKPLFIPGTDINASTAAETTKQDIIDEGGSLEDAEAAASKILTDAQTVSTSDTWSLSGMKFVFPSKAWYIENTINNLTFGFNYNKSLGRSPTVWKTSRWTWNASVKYSLQFSRENYFEPADIPLIGNIFNLIDDYKKCRVYYSPQNFSTGFSANRSRSYSLNRTAGSTPAIQRDFKASRDAGFSWRLTEGGFLNITTSYNVSVSSTLAYLLTRNVGEDLFDRSENQIWKDIFNGAFFGKDINYTQTVDFRTSPKLPSFWGLDKYLTLGFGYNVGYNWQNNLAQEEAGRGAGYKNNYQANFSLKFKSLVAPIFGEDAKKSSSKIGNSGGRNSGNRGRGNPRIPENVEIPDTNATEQKDIRPSPLITALAFLKNTARWIFFDYENINFDFSQSNSYSAGGLRAKNSGFGNFWGPFNESGGPSRSFMFGFSNEAGPRINQAGLVLKDNYTQDNRFSFKTSRPLWEGATLNLDWKVSWGVNKTLTYRTDESGNLTLDNVVSSGSIDRSFFSMPPSFFLTVFKSGIKSVNEKYDPEAADNQESLSNAFVQGFESMPVLSKIPFLRDVAKYIPRANFSVNWTGLEKFSMFKNFTKRVSLTSAYTSSYTENFRYDANNVKEISGQRVSYGFTPLAGINITFNSLLGGELSGNIRYNTKSNFSLGLANKKVTETYNRDINVSLSFSKSGFEIPLFGLSLKNDITVALSYTRGQNTSFIYDMNDFNEDIDPQEGLTRTQIEPNIKYVMSSRVTLSIFYRRSTVTPEGASSTPETTTNEAGLEVHISIQ